MQSEVLLPTIWNIILYFLMIIIEIKLWKKYIIRKNEIVLILVYAFLFMILQLTFIILNNLLEYIFEVVSQLPDSIYFPIQTWIRGGDLGNSMLIISNIYMMQFYIKVFGKEEKRYDRILLIYKIFTITLIILFLFILRHLLEEHLLVTIKYGLVILHTLVIQTPIVFKSIKLYLRIKETKSGNESKKILFIAGMSISLILVFVFAILDALNPVGWSIYYYITYAWVAMATLFAYLSYAKET